jgi:MFS family permease
MDIFYDLLPYLIGLLIIGIVYLIIYVVREGVKEKDWYLQSFLSKEDTVSQFFFLFSVFFLGITISAFNKDLGDPLSWRTILLFTSIVGVVIAYYFKVIYTLTVSLIGLAAWWGLQAAEWAQGKDIKGAALFTGLLFIVTIFYLLGRAHEKEIKFKRVSIVYSMLGLIPITGALSTLSTGFGLKILEEITKGSSFFSSWEITFFLFVFIAFIIGLLIYTLNKKLIFKQEALIICLLTLLFVIIALLPEQTIFLKTQDYFLYYRDVDLSKIGIFWATILKYFSFN